MTNFSRLNKYLMILLGFALISIFVWFRFLRTRLPRELPFTLFVLSFLIILFSTCVYLYIIYRLIKPSKQTKLFKEIYQIVLTPLEELNNLLTTYYSL